MSALLGGTKPALAGRSLADLAPADRAPLVRLRVTAALRRLFAEPARILEIGIRKPPKQVEASRRELERFFAGSRLEEVELAPGAIRGGDLPPVTVRVRDLSLMGLDLERAEFRLRGFAVDLERLLDGGELVVRRLDSIGLAFRVREEALNEATDSYRVSVRRGNFRVEGRRRILILPVGFVASGRLAFSPEGRIEFHDRSMHLNGLPLPGIFRRALRARINPVFDLEAYLGVAGEVLRVRFERILHRDRVLILEAVAEVDLEPLPGRDHTNSSRHP